MVPVIMLSHDVYSILIIYKPMFFCAKCKSSVIPTTTMTTPGKRKLPRRELPWIGKLLDKLPYSKLPTKSRVLRRLIMFEVEQHNGSCSISDAAVTTKNELKLVWEYAGYGDILKQDGKIIQSIKDLHKSYSDLVRVPVDRREKIHARRRSRSLL